MIDASNPGNGWKLADAFERTANPVIWDEWQRLEKLLEAFGGRDEFGFDRLAEMNGGRRPPGADQRRSYTVMANKERDKLRAAFMTMFTSGQLVLCGRRESPLAAPAFIPPDGCEYLDLYTKMQDSIALEPAPGRTQVYVRAFAMLHAPNAAELIQGLSETEVFARFVLNDPEVRAKWHRVVNATGRRSPDVGRIPFSADLLADDLIRQWSKNAPDIERNGAVSDLAALLIDRRCSMAAIAEKPAAVVMAVAESCPQKVARRSGRKEIYDFDELRTKLIDKVRKAGPFSLREDLINWCLEPGRVPLRAGKKPPMGKRAGDPPDRHTIEQGIARHCLDQISGLIKKSQSG